MSEQMGWRSIVENLQKEAPHWGRILPQLPQLPRLLNEQLVRNDTAAIRTQLDQLIITQRHRNRMLALIALGIGFVVLLQAIGFMLLTMGWNPLN